MRYEKHVFICENLRVPGHARGCCADKGAVEFRNLLKKKVAEKGLQKKIRINSSGCLDLCEEGPIMVVYPEQVWYGKLTAEDVDEILEEHLINNKPVERLKVENF